MHRFSQVYRWLLALTFALVGAIAPLAQAPAQASTLQSMQTTWHVGVGAESRDMAIQAAYYLPGQIWIHTGDSITWQVKTGEIHTISFLNGQQPHFDPSAPFGGNTYDGTSQTNSGILTKDGSGPPLNLPPFYTLTFTKAGDFQYNCLIHTRMTGIVHVLGANRHLPFTQQAYNQQARTQTAFYLLQGAGLVVQGLDAARDAGRNNVTVGIGKGQGRGSIFIMRFLPGTIRAHVGDTITWTNRDPEAPHTVSINMVPPALDQFGFTPYNLDTTAPPGHGTMDSANKQISSGVLATANLPGLPPSQGTTFQVKFTVPGTFNYVCAFHDDLGMKGTIVVTPADN